MLPTLHLGKNFLIKKVLWLQNTEANDLRTEVTIVYANAIELTLGLCTYLGHLV